ncbi:hypothetical protein [Hymenobacter lucidus]|uniref:PH domain-containing protein n=1 Tax=Hymenobacter lucidus TaxID=2880930 RepID=A0ABS8AWA5_9BACT|nr:hypothetical protein [Hymenobacter lucidus]MCB2409881.1 hypothetical protein [Hymenobacter lucidus]
MAGWESVNQPPNFTAVVFFSCLGTASILFSVKALAYPSVALKLASTGLWTPATGFLRWKFIQVKIESVYSGKAGSLDYLIVTQHQTQRRLDAIAIAGLNGSTDEIERLLNRYKHN